MVRGYTRGLQNRRDFFNALPREWREYFFALVAETWDRTADPNIRQEKRAKTRRAWRLAWEAAERGELDEVLRVLDQQRAEIPYWELPQQRQKPADQFEDRLKQALGSKPSHRNYR